MENITLEKVDMVRERTKVTYAEAKEALEACEGDVLEALIYIEKNNSHDAKKCSCGHAKDGLKNAISIDELKTWIKELIAKGKIKFEPLEKSKKE